MDVGSALPVWMPGPSMSPPPQVVSAGWEPVQAESHLPQPLAAIDRAMTVDMDKDMNGMLAKYAKGDMTPGQTLVAHFEMTMLHTRVLELNNFANSIKGACEKLQQNG